MKLWGGRFQKEAMPILDEFNNSISFDYKLYKEDITGSIAHAKMLTKIGVLKEDEEQKIVDGLNELLQGIEAGNIEFKLDHEDIHMNIEKLLHDKIGNTASKLHTGRSRNDQVALDIRLYLKKNTKLIQSLILNLMETLVHLSKEHIDTILPGYTHLQRAQPIRLGYYFMAYYEMLKRDYERFEDTMKRIDYLPLGCGALAGVTYKNDRDFLAKELGFSNLCVNAMDAVSDRDFSIEFLSNSSILIMHLSRMSEELIIWSSSEFGFIEIDDGYSTGSSIMPQKKNPDVAELVRGKTGRIYGNLMGILTVMKGLPLAYNKDMQEDKEGLFDTVETLTITLDIFNSMLSSMKVNSLTMKTATLKGYLNATDMADYLVDKGMSFRNAHRIVGELVAYGLSLGKNLEDMTLDELQNFSQVFEDDIYKKIDIVSCIENKISEGSTSYESVNHMLALASEWLNSLTT